MFGENTTGDQQMVDPMCSRTLANVDDQTNGNSSLIDLIRRCDGTLYSLTEAIQHFKYFDKKQTRRVPWNCNLEIEGNLVIKIAAYVYVSKSKYTEKNISILDQDHIVCLNHILVSRGRLFRKMEK